MNTEQWIKRLSEPLPLTGRDVWMVPFNEEMRSTKSFLPQFLTEVTKLENLESYTTILLKLRWFWSLSAQFKPDWVKGPVWEQIETVIHQATDFLTPAYLIPVGEWADLALRSQEVLGKIVKQTMLNESGEDDIQLLFEKLFEAKRATISHLLNHPVYGKRIQIAQGEVIY